MTGRILHRRCGREYKRSVPSFWAFRRNVNTVKHYVLLPAYDVVESATIPPSQDVSHIMTDDLVHERHKQPTPLTQTRELVLVAPPLRSNVNLSRIVRAASCCGVTRMIACGNPRVDAKIARDGIKQVNLEIRRSLLPVLKDLKAEGYQLIGLEQTNDSQNIHEFTFPRRTALVIGHERLGIQDDALRLLNCAIEIPVYGLPFSYNVATATSMALYEYCRQFPNG